MYAQDKKKLTINKYTIGMFCTGLSSRNIWTSIKKLGDIWKRQKLNQAICMVTQRPLNRVFKLVFNEQRNDTLNTRGIGLWLDVNVNLYIPHSNFSEGITAGQRKTNYDYIIYSPEYKWSECKYVWNLTYKPVLQLLYTRILCSIISIICYTE